MSSYAWWAPIIRPRRSIGYKGGVDPAETPSSIVRLDSSTLADFPVLIRASIPLLARPRATDNLDGTEAFVQLAC
jgi:hypothetical protein